MAAKKTLRHFYKSAVTGKIVSEQYALSHPRTTFKERIDPPKKPTGK